MKNARKIVIVALVMVMMLVTMILPVSASGDANQTVLDARKGVIQIRTYFVKDGERLKNSQEKDLYVSGTAFLINEENIVTAYHVIHPDDGDGDASDGDYGLTFDKLEYCVVTVDDVETKATINRESDRNDFAIMDLSDKINNRTILSLGSDNEVAATQQVFALGYSAIVSNIENSNNYTDQSNYTYEDVQVDGGTVSRVSEVAGVPTIISTANAREGQSGGPLITSNGVVVGINVYYATTDHSLNYANGISKVREICDTYGIKYTSGSVAEPTPQPTENPTSAENPTDEPATQAPTTQAPTTAPQPTANVSGNTSEKGGLSTAMLIAIIAIVVVVVIIIIVLIIMMGGKKKQPASQPRPMGPVQTPGVPMGGMPGATAPQAPQTSPGYGPRPPYPPVGSDGDSATTVLNEGAGETTVLGGGAQASSRVVVRVKNNERFNVNKPEFVIGKERRRVDFCVADNNSISRTHAKLVNRGGQLFLIDLNATNGTFVNGTKVSPGQEVRLSVGDRFKLADEEFQIQG